MGGGMMHGIGGMSDMAHDRGRPSGHAPAPDIAAGSEHHIEDAEPDRVVASDAPARVQLQVLRRNGTSVPFRQWGNTVLLAPKDKVDVAFVADNPGKWMLHCHITDHQASGMMSVLVTEKNAAVRDNQRIPCVHR